MKTALKEHLDSITTAPMAEFYDAEGVTPEILAQKGKELLGAVTPKTYKVKGWFDRTVPMIEGFRVIKGTTAETLIEQLLADNAIRLKAWIEICKQRGLYPSENINIQHGFDDLFADIISKIQIKSDGIPPLPSAKKEES